MSLGLIRSPRTHPIYDFSYIRSRGITPIAGDYWTVHHALLRVPSLAVKNSLDAVIRLAQCDRM